MTGRAAHIQASGIRKSNEQQQRELHTSRSGADRRRDRISSRAAEAELDPRCPAITDRRRKPHSSEPGARPLARGGPGDKTFAPSATVFLRRLPFDPSPLGLNIEFRDLTNSRVLRATRGRDSFVAAHAGEQEHLPAPTRDQADRYYACSVRGRGEIPRTYSASTDNRPRQYRKGLSQPKSTDLSVLACFAAPGIR